MGIKLRASPRFHVADNNGDPANGWKVHTYEPGTLTNKPTYTDSASGIANANPVVLNARGEADIWWDGGYKVVIKDANDVVIYTVDNYGAGEEVAIFSAGNWITNGSFESDSNDDGLPDNWDITEYDATSTVELDDTTQEHGEVSLKFVSTGLGGGIAESAYFGVGKSETFYLTFKYRSSVAGVRNVAELSWYTAAQSLISTTTLLDDSATNPTSFTKNTYQPTAPPTAVFAKFRFYGCHSSDATSGTTWLDDVVFNWYPIIDEDTMVSDSANYVPTQQSTKAYVDAEVATETAARVAAQGEFVSVSGGAPISSTSRFQVTTDVTESVWESVGPTGSGADNIWTGLDNVPTDVDWIEVKLTAIGASSTSDTANISRGLYAHVRKNGSSESAGFVTEVSYLSIYTTSSGAGKDYDISTPKIPVSSVKFDIVWSGDFESQNTIYMYLAGHGYN